MDWQSPFSAEVDKRRAHLESLPGYQLKEDLEALKRCLHVFSRNAADLSGHVGRFLTSPHTAKEVSEDYVDELVRLLHNYLTSVTSVIDSQRVVMRHRWPMKGSSPGACSECKRQLPMEDNLSEFETKDYAAKLADVFETGEGVFMTKLRNYCTHYSIPVPELATTLSWGQGVPGTLLMNTLQLDRDKLLRWGGWTATGKAYLKRLPQQFDLAPIIERYVNAAGQFASWFWEEINSRSRQLLDELTTKGAELAAWYKENVGPPDWFTQPGGSPPPDLNGRKWKLGLRRDRHALGTRGFRAWAVDSHGGVILQKDDDWTPLTLRYY